MTTQRTFDVDDREHRAWRDRIDILVDLTLRPDDIDLTDAPVEEIAS